MLITLQQSVQPSQLLTCSGGRPLRESPASILVAFIRAAPAGRVGGTSGNHRTFVRRSETSEQPIDTSTAVGKAAIARSRRSRSSLAIEVRSRSSEQHTNESGAALSVRS